MSDREKLIELLEDICEKYAPCGMGVMADQLLAAGVTLPKSPRPETDLTGKCGSCSFAKPATFGRSPCYVECTNADHLSRRKTKYNWAKRQRTCKACKSYTPRRVDT